MEEKVVVVDGSSKVRVGEMLDNALRGFTTRIERRGKLIGQFIPAEGYRVVSEEQYAAFQRWLDQQGGQQ